MYHISVELSSQCICHSKSLQMFRSTCTCKANNILTCRTALSMSQSENMTRGDFPPNSNEHFLTLTAQLEEFFQRKKNSLSQHSSRHFFQEQLLALYTLTSICIFCWWSFPVFSYPECVIQGWYYEEKLDHRTRNN